MYEWFNQELWEKCFSLIDPQLVERSGVHLPVYCETLQTFKKTYGRVRPWHIRINLHLDASSNKHDKRPFAYVYVVWQDDSHGFHMFRERWIKHDGKWFTRVVGLVVNQQEQAN
jgi:hypothetical protein